MCTHGPDTPPPGKNVRLDTPPIRFTPQTALPDQEPKGGTPQLNICEGDGVTGNRTQVMYVRASDVPDRFGTFLPSIRQWAADADKIYSTSAVETSGTRRIRFVTEAGCQINVLNVVLSPTGDDNFGNTINELSALGHNRSDRKYMLFVDANVYCGIGTIWGDSQPGQANINNTRTSWGRSDAGCWSGYVAAHEHMHNLGGVQLDAPHSSGGWHCVDEYDVMCYDDDGSGPVTMQVLCTDFAHEWRFDCNHDDYYNTNPDSTNYLATHWNVVNSRFLVDEGYCPDWRRERDFNDDRAHADAFIAPWEFHAFCSPDDEDWISVPVIAGNLYRFETLYLSSSADTILELYGTDGTTLLGASDDSGPGLASMIDFAPTTSGTYYLKVRRYRGASHPNQTYYVRVNTFDFPPQTFITGGLSTYVTDTTPTITYSGTDNSTPDASLMYSYRVDSGAWSAYSSSTVVTLPTLTQGAHTFSVKAKDQAGLEDATPATRSFTVDSVRPAVAAPVHSLPANTALGTSTVPVTISWPAATDPAPGTGVARYVLQQSNNGGSTWANVPLPTLLTRSITRYLTPGAASYRFRVQAIDRSGNASTLALGAAFTLTAFQETPTATVSYPSGTWTTAALSGAYGGSVRYASASGARARLAIAAGARSVGWVSTRANNRGKADVYIDGVKVTATPIDLYSASSLTRRMVFTRALNPSVAHTLEVRVLGAKHSSSTGTRVDVDAFIVQR
ncbi:MAG: hypothetical protein M3Q29_19830 [Chloroflexota bacterium]|nr:hypothetical protein [Chloroflexota bacterium]